MRAACECPRFGTNPCARHQACEKAIRAELVKAADGGWIVAPQHLFVSPAGEVLLSVPYAVTKQELEWCFHKALSLANPRRKTAIPAHARKPQRLIEEGVYDPESGPVPPQPPDLEEVLALIADAKVTPPGAERVEKMRRLVAADVAPAIEFTTEQLDESWTEEQGARLRKRIIHAIGVGSPPSYGAILVKWIGNSNPSVRDQTAVALEQLAPSAPAIVKALKAQLKKESDDKVRKNLLRALGSCGAADKGARKTIVYAAKSERKELIRINAILACGPLLADKKVSKLLGAKLKSKWPLERQAAALAMAISTEAEHLEALQAALEKERSEAVRKTLSAAFEVLRGNAALSTLKGDVKDVGGDETERLRTFGAE